MLSYFATLLAAVAAVTALPQNDPIDEGRIGGVFPPNGIGIYMEMVLFAAMDLANLPLANGLPGAPVAIDRATTIDFATASRQAFSRVTGIYTDFPENSTTVINPNVTMGLLHSVAIPVTFNADFYLDYDVSQCLMTNIRAYVRIPTQVGGMVIQPPILDTLLSFSSLPKKRATIYEA